MKEGLSLYRSQPPGGKRENLDGSLAYLLILMAATLGQSDEDTLANFSGAALMKI